MCCSPNITLSSPSFADFRAAIEQKLSAIPTQLAADLASLMTVNF